ncbi:MAG: GAF domain-containing protein, partial [Cyclobacteriaceae bacterium]
TNLRKAAEFIRDITRGNLEADWEGMAPKLKELNEETLAGELITMRDQMIRVRVDESNRMWVSDGVSKFSEIIRKNQDDLQQMSDTLLAGIVKYLGANQGGLFFLQEESNEQYLELISCFAYDKKKFIQRKISAEDGLLGQTYLEGEIILLSDIPQDYVSITSGLGDATPGNLILIPLKFNEQVVGVMEIASFKRFSEIQIELMEKISEIVASAIVNSQNASKMKTLLETAHQNAEEMRAQEEEMRQNMEELQATQEELARKEK